MQNQNQDFNLAALHSFKDEFDDTMKYMRTKMEQNPNPSVLWVIKPFFYAFISFEIKWKEDEAKKVVSDFLGSTYFILIFVFLFGFDKLLNLWSLLVLSDWFYIISIGGSYLLSVLKNFHRQTKIKDKRFDISAYAFLKQEEYQLFQYYKEAKPFTFTNLYDHIRDLTNATLKEIQGFREHLITKDKYLWEKEETIKKLSSDLKAEEQAGANLVQKLDLLLKDYKYQTEFFNHTIDSIQSMNQGCLSKDDLRVVTDYSLFEEKDGKLYRIAYHKTANTPRIIEPNDTSSKYWNWAVSRVYRSDKDVIELDVSHGRVVASKKFITSKGTFVYSFHFHETNERVYDIIEVEELHRLLYVLVLFYKDTPAYLEEVKNYAI